jgi:hypothetical protein
MPTLVLTTTLRSPSQTFLFRNDSPYCVQHFRPSHSVPSWRDQIERLSLRASSCRYLAPARRATGRESALHFITRFDAEAHRLGWTAS